MGCQYFCGFARRGTEKSHDLTIFRGTCLGRVGISTFSRDQFGWERDSTIRTGAVWTGTGLLFFSRDDGIIPNPVKSRGNNPDDSPAINSRDACYALHVRSRSHIDKTVAKKMTFAFFQNDLWRKKPHVLQDSNSTRGHCCAQLYSAGCAALIFMKKSKRHQYFRCSLHVFRLTLCTSLLL